MLCRVEFHSPPKSVSHTLSLSLICDGDIMHTPLYILICSDTLSAFHFARVGIVLPYILRFARRVAVVVDGVGNGGGVEVTHNETATEKWVASRYFRSAPNEMTDEAKPGVLGAFGYRSGFSALLLTW